MADVDRPPGYAIRYDSPFHYPVFVLSHALGIPQAAAAARSPCSFVFIVAI